MTDSLKQIEILNKVEGDGETWWKSCLNLLPNVNHPNALSGHEGFNSRSVAKDTLARLLVEGINLVYRQHNLIKGMRGEAQVLKSETISCQSSVIKLQQELITAKNDHAASIQSSVTASVENAVVKSFSEAVQAAQTNPVSDNARSTAVLNQDTLKIVVKNIVEEEDRSRNVMLFGLAEDDAEQLEEKVSSVLEELGEKPKLEAVRLGLKKGKTPRPVKVSLSNSVSVQQLLRKARSLRNSERHKTVFLAPDRCPEDRTLQKRLVSELKKRRHDEPNKKHFLKRGEVHSV